MMAHMFYQPFYNLKINRKHKWARKQTNICFIIEGCEGQSSLVVPSEPEHKLAKQDSNLPPSSHSSLLI